MFSDHPKRTSNELQSIPEANEGVEKKHGWSKVYVWPLVFSEPNFSSKMEVRFVGKAFDYKLKCNEPIVNPKPLRCLDAICFERRAKPSTERDLKCKYVQNFCAYVFVLWI